MISAYFDALLKRATDSTDFTKGKTNALMKKWSFDLSAAGEQTINLQGNFIYGFDATDGSANIDVQFSRKDSSSDTYNIVKGVGYTHPFDKLHVSWTNQGAKTLTIYIANLAPELFGITDNRSTVLSSTLLQSILDQLAGTATTPTYGRVQLGAGATILIASNTARKSAIVYNNIGNAVVYLGFSNAVASTKYAVVLDAGDSITIDDYLGDIYALGTNTQYVGTAEIV